MNSPEKPSKPKPRKRKGLRFACGVCDRVHRFAPDIDQKEAERRLGVIGWGLILIGKDSGYGVCCEVCVHNYQAAWAVGVIP